MTANIPGGDYAFTTVDERQLKAAGWQFVMRYVGPGSTGKHLTAAERDRIFAAGLSVVLLAEGAADSALGGYNTGVIHGKSAAAAAAVLGAGPDVPVYFAVDFEVTAAQWPTVAQYLRGCAAGVEAAQVGIYGSYNAMVWAARDKAARWFFQTYAWSRGAWFPGNHVEQYHNGVHLAGGTVDLCRAKVANFGQWAPGGTDMNLTDVLPDGKTTVGQALLDTSRNAYLAAVRAGQAANVALPAAAVKLDKILAAAVADTASTVTMSDGDRAELAMKLAEAIHAPTSAEVAKAVADEAAARLKA